MKLLFVILFVLPLMILPAAYASNIKIKGFIAMDVLSFEQQRKGEKKEDTLRTGVGVLDLKFYGNFGNLDSKIKLDVDTSRLYERFSLFEEVTVRYKLSPVMMLKVGKGLVPFHRKHWGVLQHNYRDSGSLLNPEHSYRDQDRKILLSFIYGSYRSGFINSFTFWGESNQARLDEKDGTPIISGRSGRQGLQYYKSKTFDTKKETGLANKLELFLGRHTFSVAGLYYQNDLNPHKSYAADIGHRYRYQGLEIWSEYTYGFTSTHPGARYRTYKKRESLFQLGAEKYMTLLFNILANIEYTTVNDTRHGSEEVDHFANDGLLYEIDTYKIEGGIKLKSRKRNAHLTIGCLYEQKNKTSANEQEPKEEAFVAAAKLAFWY